MRQWILPIAILAVLSGCSANAPTSADTTAPATATTSMQSTMPALPPSAPTSTAMPSTATTAAPASTDAAPAFVDVVWRADANTGVEAGSTYTFRRDGTLRMTSPHGTPGTGQWRYENGKLTMVEEGVAYPTDIVSEDATHLVLRSHNPGGSVEIALTRDATAQSRASQ